MKHFFLIATLVVTCLFGMPVWAQAQGKDPTPSAEVNLPAKTIPYKKEEAGSSPSASRVFLTLLVLIGIAGTGLWMVKRYFPHLSGNFSMPIKSAQQKRVKVIESVRLNPKAALYVVEFDNRTLLLSQSGDTVSVVDRRDAANPLSPDI